MKLITILLSFCALPLAAEPTKISCPSPREIKLEGAVKLPHTAGNDWKGEAEIGKMLWFFSGTEKVETGKDGIAIFSCNYGNRGNKLTLKMTSIHKAAECTQDICEPIKGKGSGKKMLQACTYSCGK
ncbi:hypothetical protein Bealeia1_00255 [Candidatus Bealeia paramacronuclearis]|uniref:DUF3757 domain-containing protein n=1 Tax=Candidatus Bealeia paramacronuclearis TaxID=1921001 RepID=A0ABZ2C0U5_9PROT|nr:hypothetical protein [Candidatus Bealeia paramacronuclearis]